MAAPPGNKPATQAPFNARFPPPRRMTRSPIDLHPAHRLLAAAALAGSAALAAAATTPGTTATPSPDQPKPRRGDYQIDEIGAVMIHAHCDEGGWVYVSAHGATGPAASASAPRANPATAGVPPDRDAALREACLAIDYSK